MLEQVKGIGDLDETDVVEAMRAIESLQYIQKIFREYPSSEHEEAFRKVIEYCDSIIALANKKDDGHFNPSTSVYV